MKTSAKIGIGLGVVVIVGGGLFWYSTRTVSTVSVAQPRRIHRRKHPHVKKPGHSSTPTVSSITAAPLGSVAWATQWQAQLSRQWGTSAPPLWIAPDPMRPHTWFACAPAAHQGALWWAYATPKVPLPPFASVSTSLQLTNAQIASLPTPMQGALNQAYDLMHVMPWPLFGSAASITAQGAMSPTQAESQGHTAAPVGWRILWSPAIPAVGSEAARPAGLLVEVILPWQSATSTTPVLIQEGMQWQTTGHLMSGGVVDVLINGLTMQSIPVSDTAALSPSSVAAGISGPSVTP